MHQNDVVVVTGSGGAGCGRAIARVFAEHGATVVVSDIDEVGGRQTAALIAASGGRAAFRPADVREDSQAQALIGFAEREFGRVTVLVNNASSPEPSADGIEGWTESLRTDLFGTLSMTRWAIESMRQTGGGAIVNLASISALWHGRISPGGFPGYDVAKAGVIRLTTGLATLAGHHDIRVNCLAPGRIATGGARPSLIMDVISRRLRSRSA
jgi:NAD(P)-dependent dehydrogenase (short-subunit alcohol dehydrogenase family)